MKTIDRLANEFYDPKIHDAHSKPSLAYYAYRAGFLKAQELAVNVAYLAIGGGSNEAVKAHEINQTLRRLGDDEDEARSRPQLKEKR